MAYSQTEIRQIANVIERRATGNIDLTVNTVNKISRIISNPDVNSGIAVGALAHVVAKVAMKSPDTDKMLLAFLQIVKDLIDRMKEEDSE